MNETIIYIEINTIFLLRIGSDFPTFASFDIFLLNSSAINKKCIRCKIDGIHLPFNQNNGGKDIFTHNSGIKCSSKSSQSSVFRLKLFFDSPLKHNKLKKLV